MGSEQVLASSGTIGERQWKGFYSVSSILLIATAVVWLAVSWSARALYASGYPADAASYLDLVSRHQFLASVTWCLWILADFLLLAPTVALYLVLNRHRRTLALLGALFAMFFNFYDVCVTELGSLTLVSLSHAYANASTSAARNSIVQAATYDYYALPIQTVLSFAIGSIGYFFWSVAMLKSPFRRWTAIFGAAMSLVGIVGAVAPLSPSSVILGVCQFVCVPGVALWFVFLGVQLYRHTIHLSRE